MGGNDLFSRILIVKEGNGKEESYITQSARFWPWSAAAKRSRAAALSVASAACDNHTEATLRPAFGAKAQASLSLRLRTPKGLRPNICVLTLRNFSGTLNYMNIAQSVFYLLTLLRAGSRTREW